MPETIAMSCWRNNSPVAPHTAGFSRNGSRASCRRPRPIVRSCWTSCCGSFGWSDHEQTARRSLNGGIMLPGLTEFHPLELLHKFNVTGRLRPKALHQFRIREPAILAEQIADARQENPVRIEERVAVAKNHLQLLDGPQRAPLAR